MALRRSKKGQIEFLIENAFRIGFAIVALLLFFVMINYYVNNKIETRYVQAEVIANRVMFSDSIMMQDPYTFRTRNGIVDMQKFLDPTSLDTGLPYKFVRYSAVKVKIYEKTSSGNLVFVGENYLNKNNYENLKNLVDSGVRGKGGAVMLIKDVPVTCAYDKQFNQSTYCIMTIEVIVPNT